MMKYVRKILCSGPERDLLTDLSFLLMRLVFGLSMAIAHGIGKVPPTDGFIGFVGKLGFPRRSSLHGLRVSQSLLAAFSLLLV